MDQFVEWDSDTSAVVTGPQGVKGGVDNWYPLVEGPEEQNPETQTVEYYFDEDQQVVTWRVTGDATPTPIQSRQWEYPSFADQLDMLWHDIDNGALDKTGLFYAALKAVKDANPK